jgi:hypothetical protein
MTLSVPPDMFVGTVKETVRSVGANPSWRFTVAVMMLSPPAPRDVTDAVTVTESVPMGSPSVDPVAEHPIVINAIINNEQHLIGSSDFLVQ